VDSLLVVEAAAFGRLEEGVVRAERLREAASATAAAPTEAEVRVHVVVARHAQVVGAWAPERHSWRWSTRRRARVAAGAERVDGRTERVEASARHRPDRRVATVAKERMVRPNQHVGVATPDARRKRVTSANLENGA